MNNRPTELIISSFKCHYTQTSSDLIRLLEQSYFNILVEMLFKKEGACASTDTSANYGFFLDLSLLIILKRKNSI